MSKSAFYTQNCSTDPRVTINCTVAIKVRAISYALHMTHRLKAKVWQFYSGTSDILVERLSS